MGRFSWSRNNRYLLTASLDSTAIIWDLAVLSHPIFQPSTPAASSSSSSPRLHTIRFDAPVASAHFHPRNSKIVLATLTCNEVVLVDFREGGGRTVLEDVSADEGMEVDGEEREKNKSIGIPWAAVSCCMADLTRLILLLELRWPARSSPRAGRGSMLERLKASCSSSIRQPNL